MLYYKMIIKISEGVFRMSFYGISNRVRIVVSFDRLGGGLGVVRWWKVWYLG